MAAVAAAMRGTAGASAAVVAAVTAPRTAGAGPGAVGWAAAAAVASGPVAVAAGAAATAAAGAVSKCGWTDGSPIDSFHKGLRLDVYHDGSGRPHDGTRNQQPVQITNLAQRLLERAAAGDGCRQADGGVRGQRPGWLGKARPRRRVRRRGE